ncbi:Uncharacterised protein r2_g2759 [Pycnogonum litorale]
MKINLLRVCKTDISNWQIFTKITSHNRSEQNAGNSKQQKYLPSLCHTSKTIGGHDSRINPSIRTKINGKYIQTRKFDSIPCFVTIYHPHLSFRSLGFIKRLNFDLNLHKMF